MTSQLNANKRNNYFSWVQLLFFSVIIVIFFFILFPQKLLRQSLMNNPAPSALSIDYLQSLVKQEPNNIMLKISLAKQLFETGEVQKANNIIEPFITNSPETEAQWNALALYYQIIRSKAFELSEKSSARKQDEAILQAMLLILVNSPYLSANDAAALANDALAFDKPQTAITLYKSSLKSGKNQSVSFYETSAKAALFVSDYKTSAQFYLLAMQNSDTIEQKRFYFMKAVDSLKASGNPASALELAKNNIGNLAKDKSILIYLAKVAIGANQPKIAEYYITQALQLQYEE